MSGPLKVFAVQVLRNLDLRGGTATVHQLAIDRHSRRRVRAALQLAAREQLVTSPDGERYTLTQKALDTIAEAKTVAAAMPKPEPSTPAEAAEALDAKAAAA